MKQLFSIVKKELKSSLDHPLGYILIIVFLVLNSFLYFRTSIVQEVASLRSMFNLLPWVFLFFIPALTMRTWAEERKENTLNVLLSYPIKIWQLILGKYLGTVILVSIMLLLTLIIPITLRGVGNFDWGVVFGQYLGAFFLIVAMVAVGQWGSSLSKNQVVAFIISIAILFAFVLVGLDFVILALPYPISVIAQQLGIMAHYSSLTRGVVDLRDILYFVSVGFVFLLLTYVWLMRMKLVKGAKDWRVLQSTTTIIILIAIVINLFGQSITIRADFTEENLYSLSGATKRVLKDLEDTVRITLYRSKKLPTQIELVSRDVQDILTDYKKFGGRHLDYTIKFPDQDDEVAKDAQTAGIPKIQFNVVRQDEFTLQEGYLGLVIEYLDEKEVIPFIQTIGDLEYQLTRNILALQSDKKKTVGIISDFGGKGLDQLTGFANVLSEQYITREVSLAQEEADEAIPSIPDDVEILVISSPTEKYSEGALDALRSYIDQGGKIFWLLSGVNVDQATFTARANTTGLEPILAEHGVTLNGDLLTDFASHENVNFSTGVFTYVLPYPLWLRGIVQPHVISGTIPQATLPWASSLSLSDEIAESSQELIKTSAETVAQSGTFVMIPEQLSSLQNKEKSSHLVAATIENVASLSSEGEEGRWVVIANAGFLDDPLLQQHPTNAVMALNSIDWLAQNEALIAIRSKQSAPANLVWESNKQQNMIKWGNIIFVPILVAGFGALWIMRRRKKYKHS